MKCSKFSMPVTHISRYGGGKQNIKCLLEKVSITLGFLGVWGFFGPLLYSPKEKL